MDVNEDFSAERKPPTPRPARAGLEQLMWKFSSRCPSPSRRKVGSDETHLFHCSGRSTHKLLHRQASAVDTFYFLEAGRARLALPTMESGHEAEW